MARQQVPMRTQKRSAAALNNENLLCRMVKHNWQPFIPTESELKRHRWGRPIGFECSRCGMKRIDLIDARGMVSWRKYIRPDGYAIPGDKLPTTATLRMEYVRRVKGITNSNKETSK